MEPRLTRSVELPERRGRPLLAAAAMAVLFAVGAHNYMMTMRGRCAVPRSVQLTFSTSPAGADVVRERDSVVLCRTPCEVTQQVGRFGVAGFHLHLAGYQDRRVLINMNGGDARVDALLAPSLDR